MDPNRNGNSMRFCNSDALQGSIKFDIIVSCNVKAEVSRISFLTYRI